MDYFKNVSVVRVLGEELGNEQDLWQGLMRIFQYEIHGLECGRALLKNFDILRKRERGGSLLVIIVTNHKTSKIGTGSGSGEVFSEASLCGKVFLKLDVSFLPNYSLARKTSDSVYFSA